MDTSLSKNYVGNSGGVAGVTGAKLLETSRIGDRMDVTINQTADLASRLTTVANRILGNVPEALQATGKESGPQPTPSFIRAADQRIDTINSELNRAFEALNRLETFA